MELVMIALYFRFDVFRFIGVNQISHSGHQTGVPYHSSPFVLQQNTWIFPLQPGQNALH